MDLTDKRIKTVVSLLAKANDAAATEAERDAYTAKATQLMIEYGIAEAQLAAADTNRPVERIIQQVIEYAGTYAPELVRLAHYVATALGLQTYQVARGGSKKDVYLVGFESDVQFARLLLGSLQIQLTTTSDAYMRELRTKWDYHLLTPGDRYKLRRAFIVGFATLVARRVQVTRETTVASATTGTDLVLANRSDQVRAWLEDAVPNLRATRSTRRYAHDGHVAGAAAGRRADVGLTSVHNDGGKKAIR